MRPSVISVYVIKKDTLSRKRLANPEFDYAKDIASFRRLFSHTSGVVVNTCHGIKGEEFHTVIAFGLYMAIYQIGMKKIQLTLRGNCCM